MQVLVREMQPNEKADIEELFARGLGIIDSIVFRLSLDDAQKKVARKRSGGALTAEYDGKIVGAVSMRIQFMKGTRTGCRSARESKRKIQGNAFSEITLKN